jgi:hypothetical protein
MDLDAAIDEMRARIDGEMLPAMLDVAEGVVDDMKSGHTFTNRTGRLEGSMHHGGASGSLLRGYRVDVIANTRYATYVDEGTSRNRPYPYLWPAWRRREVWAEGVVNSALARAVAY